LTLTDYIALGYLTIGLSIAFALALIAGEELTEEALPGWQFNASLLAFAAIFTWPLLIAYGLYMARDD
jgi:hypothetical protein